MIFIFESSNPSMDLKHFWNIYGGNNLRNTKLYVYYILSPSVFH